MARFKFFFFFINLFHPSRPGQYVYIHFKFDLICYHMALWGGVGRASNGLEKRGAPSLTSATLSQGAFVEREHGLLDLGGTTRPADLHCPQGGDGRNDVFYSS